MNTRSASARSAVRSAYRLREDVDWLPGHCAGRPTSDLILMRRSAPAQVKLKAAGGIRTLDAAIHAAELGCDRIGASQTAAILDELRRSSAREQQTAQQLPSSRVALRFDHVGGLGAADDQDRRRGR